MSRRFTLDTNDWRKIGMGAVIAFCGAGLVLVISKWFPMVLTDTKTALMLGAVFSVIVGAGRKLVGGGRR